MSEFIVCSNESADEAKIDECDKEGRATGGAETDEGHDSPCAGEDGDDEERQNKGRSKLVVVVEAMDEPCLDHRVSL